MSSFCVVVQKLDIYFLVLKAYLIEVLRIFPLKSCQVFDFVITKKGGCDIINL